MSDETAALMIDLIKKNFIGEKKKLLIDFYGGEPLLSLGLIKFVSRELKAFVQEKGGSFLNCQEPRPRMAHSLKAGGRELVASGPEKGLD